MAITSASLGLDLVSTDIKYFESNAMLTNEGQRGKIGSFVSYDGNKVNDYNITKFLFSHCINKL